MRDNIYVFGKDNSEIREFLEHASLSGKTVFTNGCFDIIHLGHVEVLRYCKTFGSTLLVGLNSDESIRRLKGDKRPILIESERASLLRAVRYVDCVIIFGEDTPFELVNFVKPDVIVKGGDYTPETVVGSGVASETHIFPLVEGAGTSKIIDKIIKRYCERRIDEN
ncbi:adenylyltransferase/cytidyltransferase family protein [candidate division WOR-3 bacterium]|nr:adenylyltransferase/cytidyltransferase family protein [candidate division WOR-3 bacterium]